MRVGGAKMRTIKKYIMITFYVVFSKALIVYLVGVGELEQAWPASQGPKGFVNEPGLLVRLFFSVESRISLVSLPW